MASHIPGDINDGSSMKPPRILFFCGERSPWGYAHLAPLLSEPRIKLVGVVMATEERWNTFRKALSGQSSSGWITSLKRLIKVLIGRDPTRNVSKLVSKHGVPVFFCDDVNSTESIEHFKECGADLLLCAAYPQIFKSEALSICPKGAFNSHPSLLPRCRGAHPVFWAIASGETRSGGTIHYMTRELDRGDIVAQIEVDLSPTETRLGLYPKLVDVIPDLISRFATFLVAPDSRPVSQDHSKATYFRQDRKIHHRIFWSEMTAVQIYDLIRACDGLAYFWSENTKVFVGRAEIAETNRNMTNNVSVPPGTVVDILDKAPIVAVQQGFVLLKSLHILRLKRPSFEIGQILY